MVKLIYFEHSWLSSHVKLAVVCNKSGDGDYLSKKKNPVLPQEQLCWIFFPFLFLANEELIFVF